MPATKTPRSTTPRKASTPRAASTSRATPRKRTTAPHARESAQAKAAERTKDFSDEVLKSLETGQRAAIDAVRKFIDTVDEKLPPIADRPARRQDVVDAAMEMADRLVHTQYDFIREVVQSAGKALGIDGRGK